MSENVSLHLSQVLKQAQVALRQALPPKVWVRAEVAAVTNRGHRYLELVEKNGDQVLAKARATMWSSKAELLIPKFENQTGVTFAAGLKVLLQVSIELHQVYGFSLNVHDIDPTYSLGELERKKKEAIARLKSEGLYDLNKNQTLIKPLRNIAIIASPTSAGIGDFFAQLKSNRYGYRYHLALLPAVVQGTEAVGSIRRQLAMVDKHHEQFDAVALLRGGGGKLDLNCFDEYALAAEVARCQIPVLTGIGHEKDESVCDMVAYGKLKTPTALAEFIVSCSMEAEEQLIGLQENIISMARALVSTEKNRVQLNGHELLSSVQQRFRQEDKRLVSLTSSVIHGPKITLSNSKNHVAQLKDNLERYSRQFLNDSVVIIDGLSTQIKHLDPKNVLRRGYSVTYADGKALKNVGDANIGTRITTKVYDGEFISEIIKKRTNE